MNAFEEYEARAEARGEARGQVKALLKLLDLKFGPVSAEAEEHVRQGSPAELERWLERVLSATSLDAVLAD